MNLEKLLESYSKEVIARMGEVASVLPADTDIDAYCWEASHSKSNELADLVWDVISTDSNNSTLVSVLAEQVLETYDFTEALGNLL